MVPGRQLGVLLEERRRAEEERGRMGRVVSTVNEEGEDFS